MVGFIVPVVLVSCVIAGIGNNARLVVGFPSLKEEAAPSLRVWKTSSIAKRKYGVVDPVLSGDVESDTPFVKMACKMLEMVDCDYLDIKGG